MNEATSNDVRGYMSGLCPPMKGHDGLYVCAVAMCRSPLRLVAPGHARCSLCGRDYEEPVDAAVMRLSAEVDGLKAAGLKLAEEDVPDGTTAIRDASGRVVVWATTTEPSPREAQLAAAAPRWTDKEARDIAVAFGARSDESDGASVWRMANAGYDWTTSRLDDLRRLLGLPEYVTAHGSPVYAVDPNDPACDTVTTTPNGTPVGILALATSGGLDVATPSDDDAMRTLAGLPAADAPVPDPNAGRVWAWLSRIEPDYGVGTHYRDVATGVGIGTREAINALAYLHRIGRVAFVGLECAVARPPAEVVEAPQEPAADLSAALAMLATRQPVAAPPVSLTPRERAYLAALDKYGRLTRSGLFDSHPEHPPVANVDADMARLVAAGFAQDLTVVAMNRPGWAITDPGIAALHGAS